MKKPWSITTTLRNPERLRNFLVVLQQLDNSEWDLENQKKYQIFLIQNRIYGYGSRQFYNGLSQKQIDLIDDSSKNISFKEAEEIFNAKKYEDPAMRGRQSINPLKKMGLVAIKDGKVFITDPGKLFLKDDFDFDDRSILLEKLSALGLHALNDALKIQPNYPVGDDNEPTFTAPANTPDIECFYKSFNAICEVTMLKSRDQWYNEGQPVMRHLRDFENKHSNKTSYCLFIAPIFHRDTINTFWTAIKYEYEGRPQKIVPLSINHFVSILKILVQIKTENKFLKHSEISRLYDEILDSSNSFNNSSEWLQSIPNTISSWQESLSF